MNWRDVRETIVIVVGLIAIFYSLLTISNKNDDVKNKDVRIKLLERQDSVWQKECSTLMYSVDSIKNVAIKNDSIIIKLQYERKQFKTYINAKKKIVLSNPDSTANFVKQRLSSYTEKEF